MARAIELENQSVPAQLLPTSHQESQSRMATRRCAENLFLKNFNSTKMDPSCCTSHFSDRFSGEGCHPDPLANAHVYPTPPKRGDHRERLSHQQGKTSLEGNVWQSHFQEQFAVLLCKKCCCILFVRQLKGKAMANKIFVCFLQLREF